MGQIIRGCLFRLSYIDSAVPDYYNEKWLLIRLWQLKVIINGLNIVLFLTIDMTLWDNRYNGYIPMTDIHCVLYDSGYWDYQE